MYKWTDELLCGREEIDEQHMQLFELISNISTSIDSGKDREALKDAFVFLEKYVKRHFALEEYYMEFYKYSGYVEHKAEHEQFYDDFTVLRSNHENAQSSPPVLASELEGALYHWLARHFDKFDRPMCIFLKDKILFDPLPLRQIP